MRADTAIKSIVIVGGGTAGWLAANYLARCLKAGPGDDFSITLIESPDIPTIGVGEGTVPSMRQTLKFLGISETEFIRECDATFKQSIEFVDWLHVPKDGKHHRYYHLFDDPIRQDFDLTPYWLKGCAGATNYADAVSMQSLFCDQSRGPKHITTPEYEGASGYAYHLDAVKFAKLLTRHATERHGVRHLLGNVTQVVVKDTGHVDYLDTDRCGRLQADFYVDCSGFASLLVGGALGVPFIDKGDELFVDHAVAIQVPYVDPEGPIASQTISTARDAGWIWDIGLSARRGTGYVYSSKYTDHDTAEQVIRDYIGPAADELPSRKIPMRIGYRETFWQGNCVAIGLSQGFIEPLEATALLMVDGACRMLAEQFPTDSAALDGAAKRYNRLLRYGYDRVIDFIKLHYYLSRRDDSAFWIDNRRAETVSDHLLERLDQWRYAPPSAYDFFSKFEVFNLENYLYVLYGMDFVTDMASHGARYPEDEAARRLFDQIRQARNNAAVQMPDHRGLIDKIHKFGLQKT
ncbi:tryptophan halogenase family protein [Paremcibacter congregatus]|uniref:tryptophan halogenase family protein n=1 Tax=Paremcibacter congregatus TaxID=2043170 RepID=UPI003A958920